MASGKPMVPAHGADNGKEFHELTEEKGGENA